MPSMPTITAIILAFNLINSGKPAKVVDVGHGQAVVILEGRPGCHAEALDKNPNNPVVVCSKPKGRAAK